jgi:hypothetical protein
MSGGDALRRSQRQAQHQKAGLHRPASARILVAAFQHAIAESLQPRAQGKLRSAVQEGRLPAATRIESRQQRGAMRLMFPQQSRQLPIRHIHTQQQPGGAIEYTVVRVAEGGIEFRAHVLYQPAK